MTSTNQNPPGPDDDAISLTSTISDLENTDEEWTAEGIIAEGKVGGETRYLVDWTGFALKDATWEPREHVEGLLLDQWAEVKELQRRGEAEIFNMKLWTDAWKQELREKFDRHERRNELRELRGLATSEWASTLDELIQQTAEYYPKMETRDEYSLEPMPPDENMAIDQVHPTVAAAAAQTPLSPIPPNSLQQPVPKPADGAQNSENKSTKGADGPAKKSPVLGQQASKALPSAIASATKTQATPTAASRPAPQRTASGNSAQGKGMLQLMRNAKGTKPKVKATKSGSNVAAGVVTKRTNIATQNVFAGGRVVKKRRDLVEAASDITKEPKLLNYRSQRIIETRRRDMENKAPPNMPKRLISLDPTLPNIERVTDSSSASHSPEDMAVPTTHSPEAMDGVISHSPETIAGVSSHSSEAMVVDTIEEPPPKPKKRKSVRWTDELISEEPMQIDSSEPSLFISDDRKRSPMPPPRRPTPPPSVAAPYMPPRDTTKTCRLGPNTQPVDLVFRNVPQNTSPLLGHFMDSDAIDFSHICISEDVKTQLRPGTPARLCDLASGYISCPTHEIQNVVDRLRLHSQGVMSLAQGYLILCFPTKCEDWDFEQVNGTDDADSPLRFIVLQVSEKIQSSCFAQSSDDRSESSGGHGELLISNGLNKFLTLNHSRLVPPVMQDYREHHYFLAFPMTQAHSEEMAFLSDWLFTSYLSSSVKCFWHNSHTPGSWSEFSAHDDLKRGGIIILHEDAMECVRYLPNIQNIIRSEYFPIYAFTRSTGRSRTFPSAYALDGKLGHLHLERVFPQDRKVFLLTPSFILSQPLEAGNFMEWFKGKYVKSGDDFSRPARLAFSHDIDDWMSSLIVEQVTKRVHRSHHVHLMDVDAWQQVWEDITELAEKPDYLIYAPKGIDGNDEQSLVNWLGSWSIRHMDEASEIWVLGSASHDPNRMTKNVTPFEYAPGTVGDPEQAQRAFELSRPQDHAETNYSPVQNNGHGHQNETQHNPEGDKNIELKNGGLKLTKDESPYAIREFLRGRFTTTIGKAFTYIMVNNMPVTQWVEGIEDLLGSQLYDVLAYERWLKFCEPFRPLRKTGYNTYGGFFYTFDDVVQNDRAPMGIWPKFRPWAAFLRPLNPHHHQVPDPRDGMPYFETSQLLIWDPGYRGKFGDRETIHEEELVDAQRQLMRVVTAWVQGGKWNMPLASVRVAWEPFEKTTLVHPVDLCLETLRLCDRDAKAYLPAPEHKMQEIGWTYVEPFQGPRENPETEDYFSVEEAAAHDGAGGGDVDEIFTIPDPGFDIADHISGAEEMKIIFHPPRSTKKQSDRPASSLCKNLLYRTVHSHQNNHHHHHRYEDVVLSHRFTMTNTWYGQQVSEGRDYKNIVVAPFPKVFEELGIPFHRSGYRPSSRDRPSSRGRY